MRGRRAAGAIGSGRSCLRRVHAAVLAALVIAAASACTGVPTSSSPNVVRSIGIGEGNTAAAATTPAPGIAPRNLVSDFLAANVADASSQTSPRGFLSSGARNSWSDTSVTVVDDLTVGFYDPSLHTVVVSARVLGTVSSTGVYSPTLSSSTSARQPFVYGVNLVNGQYRISSLRSGLLLTEKDFLTYFTQRAVYYFDLAHRYLVPDARWTSLTDPTELADWLMAGLTQPPSSEIQSTVSTDTLPTQASARRISVSIGSTTEIEIPGSSQLSAVGRNRLAEVVANTLADVVHSDTMQITDGGRPISIPFVRGTRFTADEFTAQSEPAQPPAEVYFLRKGKVYSSDGSRLTGAVNDGAFFLQQIAVSQDPEQLSTNEIAATASAGNGSAYRLLVGTQAGGMRRTDIQGPLTRPAFAPGRSEVWVGDGRRLLAVEVNNQAKTEHVYSVGLPSVAAGDTVVELRLSPEGSRIAMILRSGGGAQQVYVGSVVRGPGQIRVDSLQQVTPEGVVITDLAWAESLKLLAIGYFSKGLDHRIFDVGADGSGFGSEGVGNLPNIPTTITVAPNQAAWVTAGSNSVWQQSVANKWVSPVSPQTTVGYGAIYLE